MLKMAYIRIAGVLAAIVSLAAVCLPGCSRDDLDEELPAVEEPAGEPSVGDAYIRFRMNLRSGMPAGTRVGEAGDAAGGAGAVADSLPGSSREDAINTLDLFVFDAETEAGTLFSHVSLGKTQIASIANSKQVITPVSVIKGKKVRIYAVANLPEAKRQLFVPNMTGTKIYFMSTQDDYWKVIDEFVPGCAGKQELLESSCGSIPMTGLFKTADGSSELVFTEEHMSESTALSVKADLTRIVAKIHVVADTRRFTLSNGETVDYAVAEDKHTATHADPAEDFSNWLGWIRLANVRYMPNGTNKSTYLFPQEYSGGAENKLSPWVDRNMTLDNYIVGGQFNAPMWSRDYSFYNVLALHRENISASRLARAEAYDAERMQESVPLGKTPYTQGMYCLENYFSKPLVNEETQELFDRFEGRKGTSSDAIPMVTSVAIAAKLTPRNIVVVADYLERMNGFVDEFYNAPDEFRAKYGLIRSDFTEEDAELWRVFKEERYKDDFTGDATLYRSMYRIIRTKTEKDAAAIINWSLMCNELWSGSDFDFENGKYPAATFYVYDTDYDLSQSLDTEWNQRYLYLTAGAVAAAKDDNVRIKTYSVPHLGGWGYYFTYLDQTGEPYRDASGKIVEGRTPYTASQVTRNTYYLIHVVNFGLPGGTITRPEYIKVNTVPVDWDYKGRGDINLH